MNIEELKMKHPETYAQCIAEGKKLVVDSERKRILATLPKTSRFASERYAIECIKNGSPCGNKQKAKYLALQLQTIKECNHDTQLAKALEKALNVGKDG